MAEPFATCWLDGAYLPLAEARVSPLDRGFLFADGVYEVVPVHRGRPFRLRQHLERLERSLDELRMRNALPREGWVEVVDRLVGHAGAPEVLVYLQVTRGVEFGRNHLFPPATVAPTGFAFVSPYPAPAPATLQRGLAASLLEDTRWARCDVKAVALLANVLLRQEAQPGGAGPRRGRSDPVPGGARDGRLVQHGLHRAGPPARNPAQLSRDSARHDTRCRARTRARGHAVRRAHVFGR
jgi:D-alanine transaminase